MPDTPFFTIVNRCSLENMAPCSLRTNICSQSHIVEALSIRYLCPNVKGSQLHTTAPLAPLGHGKLLRYSSNPFFRFSMSSASFVSAKAKKPIAANCDLYFGFVHKSRWLTPFEYASLISSLITEAHRFSPS